MPWFNKGDDCLAHYKLGKTLGTGSFATVKQATHKAEDTKWAIKCIKKESLEAEDEEALQSEVSILQDVSHPNIVELKEVFDTPKTFYMVMEVMQGGELFDRIVEKEKFSEHDARVLVRKLCTAIKYCHDKGIVHRDLKPENLLFADDTDESEIKIADFGLARIVTPDSMMETACGTPGYVAPEILSNAPYGAEVDMWSIGVITYILLCGFPPFYDDNNASLFEHIKSGTFDYPSPYWDSVSDGAKEFINKLLVVNPQTRLTAAGVLEEPWITAEDDDGEHLEGALAELRRFNARRKFRAGVITAKIVRAMAAMGAVDAY
eukprot:g7462.t1